MTTDEEGGGGRGVDVVPLAGIWLQVVTTLDPVPHGIDAELCLLVPSVGGPVTGRAAADDGDREGPSWRVDEEPYVWS